MSRAWPVDDLDCDASLATNARRILAVKMAEYYAYAPIVPIETAVEELHNLRIAAKRLRYTLELFRVVFEERGEAQIDRVKAIQEELGAIHDHDVRIALIEDELAVVAAEQSAAGNSLPAALAPPPNDPRRGLIDLLGRERVRRGERYRAFRELWDCFMVEGMRADLATLSAMPLAETGTAPAFMATSLAATGGPS